jgi:polyisoprenoid-binding protein YceI
MRLTIIAFVALSLTACVENVGTGKVKADVQDVPAVQVPAVVGAPTPAVGEAPEATAKTLSVDVSKSHIKALGAKVTAKHPVVFHTFSGTVTVQGPDVTGVQFEADIASLEADKAKLTGHLKAEDFLWADKYPKATFASSSIVNGSKEQGDWSHTVVGNLNIRGVTKQVTFPAKISSSSTEVLASSEFVIDRQWFGVTYPGRADDLVQDEVVMNISFVAPLD